MLGGQSSVSIIGWIKMSEYKVPLMSSCVSNVLYSVVNIDVVMPCLIENVS